MAMKQRVPLKNIKPNPNNPRFIKDDKFKKLVQSLKDFPEMAEIREVVINKDNVILGGNMRYKAMLEAGWEEIPVRVVDWPEAKQKEFIVKDNLAMGDWSWDDLANEWDSKLLDDWGLDLPTSFGEQEVEEDEAPEVSSEPAVSKLGEIYQLGKHRLMCGDSTERESVLNLMDGQKADMVFTDPPYGVDYDGGAKKRDKLIGDEAGNDVYKPSLKIAFEVMTDNSAFYLWYADANIAAAAAAGFIIVAQIIWVKNNAQFVTSAHYKGKHEPCFYGHKKGKSSKWYGENNQVTVWEEDRANKNEYHPTQKPVALAWKAINNSSKKEDIVLDLFGGSGSTLIACEQLGRICYMAELDPKYCDVIRKRYAKFVNSNELPSNWAELTPVID